MGSGQIKIYLEPTSRLLVGYLTSEEKNKDFDFKQKL
jgi:hypothetical protein